MGTMGNTGMYAQLLQALQGGGAQGFTNPGGGSPQLPQFGGGQMNTSTPQMPQGQMPPDASSTPQGGGLSGIMQNPQLMALLAQHMNGGQPGSGAGVAAGAAGIGAQGQSGGMSGADANTMRSQLQGGAPNTEMISPQFMQRIQGGAQQPNFMQQLMARLQGGGQ